MIVHQPLYATERWVEVMLSAVTAVADPRTMNDWSRLACLSTAGLASRCRAVDISAKRSLELARLTRAVLRGRGTFEQIEEHLNIVDPRTISRILRRAGVHRSVAFDPDTLPGSFFDVQTLLSEGRSSQRHRLQLLAHRIGEWRSSGKA
jgi:hypothetical protein